MKKKSEKKKIIRSNNFLHLDLILSGYRKKNQASLVVSILFMDPLKLLLSSV